MQAAGRAGGGLLAGGAPGCTAVRGAPAADAGARPQPPRLDTTSSQGSAGAALLKRRRATPDASRAGLRPVAPRAFRRGTVQKHAVRKWRLPRSALARAAGGTLAWRVWLKRRVAFARRSRYGVLYPGWVEALARGLGLSDADAGRDSVPPPVPESLLKRRRAAWPMEVGAQENAANWLLSLGVVPSPAGRRGVLQPKDVGAGGWCVYAAFYDHPGSTAIPSSRDLAVLALVAMAGRRWC